MGIRHKQDWHWVQEVLRSSRLFYRSRCVAGPPETPCQHPCNVEEHDWVLHEQGRVSDVKLRGFRGIHVRSVRLIQQRRDFAEHCARLCHLGDLDGFFDDCHRALLENQQPTSPRTAGKDGFADLVSCKRKGAEPLLERGYRQLCRCR
jgi:hypothetical protein